MAHAACINGHIMWNGVGTPVVEAYRIGFFRELLQKEPDCVINHDHSGKYPYIYDCVDGVPGEELDIWYCDECGAFIVFVNCDEERLDYTPCDVRAAEDVSDFELWQEYVAFRENSDDYEAFHDYCDGKSPLDALLTYGFKYRYHLSPDREYILRAEKGKGITAAFRLAQHVDFTNETYNE